MKTFLFAALLVMVSVIANAQEKEIPVNLPVVMKLARANNLTIKQYGLQYQRSLDEVDKAKEWFLPNLFLGPTFHYLKGATIQTSGQLLTNVTQKELWLGGGLSGEWDFKRIFDLKAIKQQSEAVKAMSQAQRNNIILQSIDDYYDLATEQFNYNQMLFLLAQADTLSTQIKIQVDAGIRYQSEYLLARSNYDHIRIELINSHIEMRIKSDALLNLLNVDTAAVLVSSDSLIVPTELVKNVVDTNTLLFSQYTQARPEYKAMQSELNAILYQRKTETVGLLMPKIVIGTPDALLGTFGTPYYNSYHLDGGLLWDIPLGKLIYKGDLKVYNDNILIQQNNMQQFGNEVRQQVNDARLQLIQSMQKMKISQEALNETKNALQQSVAREKLGTVKPFEVFQSEQFYVQAELDYLKVVSDYNKAQYRLYVATGNNL